jgi:transcriptional regulator with XRE-family HTH domain
VTGGRPGPAADPRAEAMRGFGRYLLRERELRGLSPEDVARVTRLAPSVIEAIESGDPDRMPPRGYLVAYLRSYSAAVGLGADDVVLRFQEAAGGVIIAAVAALVVAAAAAAVFRRSGADPSEIRGRKSTERAPYRAPGVP